jgi:hypothetical protein
MYLAEHDFQSSDALDQHHHRLLMSDSDDDVVAAIFSVMYWGHYSAGVTRYTRCDWLERGNARNAAQSLPGLSLPCVLAIIRCAARQVKEGDLAAALKSVMYLPHVGESFASKYLAFIDPENVGVFDRHIHHALEEGTYTPMLGADCVAGILAQPRSNGRRFQAFCNMLNAVKDCLNRQGCAAWHNATGGALGRFRAIDVERALFQIARNRPAVCPRPLKQIQRHRALYT